MKSRRVLVSGFFILLFLLFALAGIASAESELSGGRYMTVVDEQGKIVLQTGIRVVKGDEYIAANNNRYRIVRIEGLKAYAKFVGKEKVPDILGYQPQAISMNSALFAKAGMGNKPTVAIYHTHDDESYTPTDGQDSIRGNGGIFKVGNALASALKGENINVIHDTSKHDPHDVNAYNRSRRTAT
jgi:stage II sporulation protein P